MHQDALYKKVEVMVRPILESNARRFAYQLGMTVEEALQEARLALVLALREYDYNSSRGGIYNFVKVVVHRHFLKAWSKRSTQGRRPHLTIEDENGKRKMVPVQRLDVDWKLQGKEVKRERGTIFRWGPDVAADFLDLLESPVAAPDATLIEADQEDGATKFERALCDRLRTKTKTYERDRNVLRCKLDPPDGLRMMMLDDLAEEPTIPLIGLYLGLSKNEVDWALRRIRDAALELIGREFSDLTDLAVVRAYVDKRP